MDIMLFIATTRYRVNKLPNEISFCGHFQSTEKIEVPVLIQRFPTFFSSLPTFDVTDPQLPQQSIAEVYLSDIYQPVRCKKKVYTSAGVLFRENIGEEQKTCL